MSIYWGSSSCDYRLSWSSALSLTRIESSHASWKHSLRSLRFSSVLSSIDHLRSRKALSLSRICSLRIYSASFRRHEMSPRSRIISDDNADKSETRRLKRRLNHRQMRQEEKLFRRSQDFSDITNRRIALTLKNVPVSSSVDTWHLTLGKLNCSDVLIITLDLNQLQLMSLALCGHLGLRRLETFCHDFLRHIHWRYLSSLKSSQYRRLHRKR